MDEKRSTTEELLETLRFAKISDISWKDIDLTNHRAKLDEIAAIVRENAERKEGKV